MPCLTAADDAGYEIDEAEVIYWGRCPDCVAAAATDHTHANHATTERGGRRVREREPRDRRPDTRSRHRPRTNQDWWPNQLDLSGAAPALARVQPDGRRLRLRRRSSRRSTSTRSSATSIEVMTTSQDWWPADYGHYGPLFIRMTLARRRHVPHRGRSRRRRRAARSASRRSTAGPTTRTSTRRAGCSGRSSRSTAARSRGPT